MLITPLSSCRIASTWSCAAQVDERQQVAAQAVDRRPVDLLDSALGLLAFEPDQLEQADLGDGVAVAAGGDGQRRDDGQRERDLHLHRGAVQAGRLSMSTVPPIFSTLVRTTSMPTPRPEKCVTRSAVENPAGRSRLTSSRSASRAACSGVISLFWTALSRTRRGSMPRRRR